MMPTSKCPVQRFRWELSLLLAALFGTTSSDAGTIQSEISLWPHTPSLSRISVLS